LNSVVVDVLEMEFPVNTRRTLITTPTPLTTPEKGKEGKLFLYFAMSSMLVYKKIKITKIIILKK